MKNKYQAYASATQTVAKTQQIVMLYDGAIRYIQQAKEAIRDKRIEDRYNLLIKAGEIIVGLQACLDFENGKEIARILYNFYSSIDTRMFSIHRTNSMETCDEIIEELKQMRSVWYDIDKGASADASVQAEAEPENTAPPASPENITLSA
jgi:flagellar protein FliS